ncbi:hypothetical protein SAMN04488021_103120 [Paracoccus aminovorans]|uniref:Uncharacterized protein n=1 Tax=Paracoccus aminovorans TaxID=34004 RepID=A0A1I2Y9B5_9RHOB|nr:DUF6497 family protein [Paracoccus aminovorans]CQR86155.1 hypothetical protein JCM7685_1586 [Paracoccus aminovorans]SFH21949.1 hypothetical protein SAMN04488021_103120 [Paracoccus aminovorans]
MSRLAAIGLALFSPALAAGGPVAGGKPAGIRLPSGATATWQETRHDSSGGLGLIYRFRFVMPDLAARMPANDGPGPDFAPAEAGRGPIDIDTETGEVLGAEAEAEPAPPPETGEEMPDEAAEQEADALVEGAVAPPAPDELAQDPIHADIVWLCENWVLPRIASPAPRPSQIVISLASKEIAFGAYDPEAVQLFEAFRLPPDRDACEWEPW